MVSVLENAPEFAGHMPEHEWVIVLDPDRIASMLRESSNAVRQAVKSRVEERQALDLDFEHPIHLLQFLIFHEGYHHGQMELALKLANCAIPDSEAAPLTWKVWRARTQDAR
jgi:uncharacterized damage-inducible protein DinB